MILIGTKRYEKGPGNGQVRNGPDLLGDPAISYPSVRDQKQAVRNAINRASPGLLNFLDLAKAKFPSSKLAGLGIRNESGQMEAIGALHNGKPDGQ